MYHTSILDTDLYKPTMQNAICKLYPRVKVRYTFINRDKREFPDGFASRLKEIIQSFKAISLTAEEADFLNEKCYYLNPQYVDFLRGYRYDPSEVLISQDGPKLLIAVEGWWYRTILWEVPLMEAISELYFEMTGQHGTTYEERHILNRDKAVSLAANNIFYSEFGSRRRFSYDNQDRVVQDLIKFGQDHMVGTSNVHLAMKHNLIPMGTVAHEWFQFHGARYGYKMANERALEAWTNVYEGDLGIALPDTFTSDVFFKSFSTKYAKLFDGVRQDSGDPIKFLDKALGHYKSLRINSMFKIIMFSDNLKSLDQIKAIHEACRGITIDRYGIGTWLSNDCGVKPLNIVIKLTACNFNGEWVNTVKLSDDLGKNTGDSTEVKLCKEILGVV